MAIQGQLTKIKAHLPLVILSFLVCSTLAMAPSDFHGDDVETIIRLIYLRSLYNVYSFAMVRAGLPSHDDFLQLNCGGWVTGV